jgi:acyl carrier protein
MPTLTKTDIYSELTPVFRGIFDDPTIELRDEMTANDIERWDSLNHINMIVAVEQKFGIKFKTIEVTRFKNLGELVASIESKLAKKI